MQMNLHDKISWLEQHGETHTGHSIDNSNYYCQWISYTDSSCYSTYFMPNADDAIDRVFNVVKDMLFDLCNDTLI